MTPTVFRFADFVLDVATRELRRRGEAVAVPPRSFDVIAYLVAHRDRAVGRDELVSAVWGRTAVSDTVLGKAILGARRALEDTVDAPRFIRTVSRFGYHWIAAVEEGDGDAAAAAVAPPPAVVGAAVDASGDAAPVVAPQPAPPSPSHPARATPAARRWWLLALAVLALVLAVAFVVRAVVQHRDGQGTAVPAVPVLSAKTASWSAAVIPATVSGRDEDAWLRLGVMDLIAVRLRGAGIATMPSEAAIRLVPAGMAVDAAARAVREAANVDQVFEPSVRRDGANWAVKIALMRPEGVTVAVEESAVDPIVATHAAVDRLLQVLGHAPGARDATGEQLTLQELLQRLEAARLGDDFATTRKLVAEAPPDLARRPEVRLRLARLDLRAGHPDDALAALDALLAEVPAETSPTLRTQVLYARGTALLLGTHLEQARAAYDDGVALIEHQHVDPDVAANLYMGRGNLAALQDRFEDAAADYARARVAFQLADDAFTTFWLDGNEGALQNHRGRPAAALPLLQRAEQHFARYNVYNELVTTQANEVVAHLALVQPADALAASERSLPLLGRIGDASLRRLVQLRHAMALAAVGRDTQARAVLAEVIAGADARDEASVRGSANEVLAGIEMESGQADAAAAAAQAALADLSAAQDVPMRATAWLIALRAQRAAGQVDSAAGATRAMSDWAAQAHDALATQRATLATAEQAAAAQRSAIARDTYDDALRQAAALDLPSALVDTVVSYAGFLIDAGDLDAATAVAGRVSRYAEQDYASAALQVRLHHALGHAAAENLARERLQRLAGERPASAD